MITCVAKESNSDSLLVKDHVSLLRLPGVCAHNIDSIIPEVGKGIHEPIRSKIEGVVIREVRDVEMDIGKILHILRR